MAAPLLVIHTFVNYLISIICEAVRITAINLTNMTESDKVSGTQCKTLVFLSVVTCVGYLTFMMKGRESIKLFYQNSCERDCDVLPYKNNSYLSVISDRSPRRVKPEECLSFDNLRNFVLEDIRKTWKSPQWNNLREKGTVSRIGKYRATCWQESVSL